MEAWQERMIKEYDDLCSRIRSLESMVHDYQYNCLPFEPNCPIYLLQLQLDTMREYRDILEARNYIENIL